MITITKFKIFIFQIQFVTCDQNEGNYSKVRPTAKARERRLNSWSTNRWEQYHLLFLRKEPRTGQVIHDQNDENGITKSRSVAEFFFGSHFKAGQYP